MRWESVVKCLSHTCIHTESVTVNPTVNVLVDPEQMAGAGD